MVEITPEIQAQLDEAKKQCPFCKIIAGEIPSDKVYVDDEIIAILDINPWTKGHVLLMPKEHYPIMPYIPAKTFKRLFGKMAKFIKALTTSLVMTGANVVIANGHIAGQQSPHFLVHVLPREEGDKLFDKYSFNQEKELNKEAMTQANAMLKQNIPIMLNNHFNRNPQEWRKKEFKTDKIYEDEKVIVEIPEKSLCVGHLKIIPKDIKNFEECNETTSSHIFFVASFCATAVFEGLGAHGSNIVLKTGNSDDNQGEVSVHVLPRYENDGLDIVCQPLAQKPNNKELASRISDETYILKIDDEPEEFEIKKPINNPIKKEFTITKPKDPENLSPEEEINLAIENVIVNFK
jgi:histidine triad (HIT) family protein